MIQGFWALFIALLNLVAPEAIFGVGSVLGVLPTFTCDFLAVCVS